MRPSHALADRKEKILEVVARFHVSNVRVFGSVVHGTDKDGSDLDLLVDPRPGTTLFDLGGLQVALEDMLGVPVDVVTPEDLPARIRARVVSEARPL